MRSVAILILAMASGLAAASTAAARTISWSGYTWDVRPAGFGAPGPNRWSDSPANVRVDGSDLVLSIVQDGTSTWTSAEVDNQSHLGYGTYRWVVESDLSTIDAHEVLGMFTWGGSSPSNNEIDIEAARWGNLAWPSGSGTVWQDYASGANVSRSFRYSARPPYVNQFTWEPGRITYLITDAAGAVLFRWVVTSGVPVPSAEVPMINYWRFENEPPAGVRSMRLSSFTWSPPGTQPPPVPQGEPPAGGATAGSLLRMCAAMSPRRFARRRGSTITWRATGAGRLRLLVERRLRGGRYVRAGALERPVSAGTGQIRIKRRLAGRRLRPGRYRLVVDHRDRCGPRSLTFRVRR